MKPILIIAGIFFALYSCNTKNVKKEPANETKSENYTFANVKPGIYSGTGEEAIWFSVTLISENDTIKATELGFNFTRSSEVEPIFLRTGGPFGIIENGKFYFQFPTYLNLSLSTSLTSEDGGSAMFTNYSAEITKTSKTDELNCKLTKINELDPEYNDFIDFILENKGVVIFNVNKLNDYTLTLKLVVND